MAKATQRSVGLRALNAICTMVLLLTGLYILLAGFHIAALALLLSATAGVVIPVVLSGVGILEMLSGIFEAMLDGIMAVFEAIADFFTGLFG